MTTYEILSTVTASLALVVSVAAFLKASAASERSNSIAAENLKLVHAQVENEVNNQIREATNRLQDFMTDNVDFFNKPEASLTAAEKKKRTRLKKVAESLIEEYLNAYDQACQKYRDGKIDKVRFKKNYDRHIQRIGEDKDYGARIRHGHDYAALRSVYDEWENHEKD